MSEKLILLTELQEAASELAQYASYAEIVGGINVNKKQIRNWCDKVFALNHKINEIIEE